MTAKKKQKEVSLVDEENLSSLVAELGASETWSIIKKQFKENCYHEIYNAQSEARREQRQRDSIIEKVCQYIGGAIGACVAGYLILIFCYAIGRENNKAVKIEVIRINACKSGDTMGCLEAVHSQGGTFPNYTSQKNAVQLYRTLYHTATGKDLPLLDGEKK